MKFFRVTTSNGAFWQIHDVNECAYCGAETADAAVPATDDDEGWEDIAGQHAGWCEWVTTRAHRR